MENDLHRTCECWQALPSACYHVHEYAHTHITTSNAWDQYEQTTVACRPAVFRRLKLVVQTSVITWSQFLTAVPLTSCLSGLMLKKIRWTHFIFNASLEIRNGKTSLMVEHAWDVLPWAYNNNFNGQDTEVFKCRCVVAGSNFLLVMIIFLFHGA